jgi:hypothetical protein
MERPTNKVQIIYTAFTKIVEPFRVVISRELE